MTNQQCLNHPSLPSEQPLLSRRRFLQKISYTAGGVTAALVGLPLVGFLFAPLFQQKPLFWRAVGDVSKFQVGETVVVTFEDASPLPWAGVTAHTAAWLRRVGDKEFVAFAINCSHLGCPVTWLPNAKLFMCPCHGGVYNADGSVAAGPPPQPLSQYPVRINQNQVEIRTTALPLESA